MGAAIVTSRCSKLISNNVERLLIMAFIDSVLLHCIWRCHRLGERSFFLRGRQFHVCSRCTGLIAGLPASIALVPLSYVFCWLFPPFLLTLLLDGLTQFAGWRESNNSLRFASGFGTTACFLPCLITLARFMYAAI